MGFFNKSKKADKLPKEVEKIFKKAFDGQKPRLIVDKAISFRNLGEFDKAIDLLVQVIKNYPEYHPAETSLGVTLIQKGDMAAAENCFKGVLERHSNDKTFSPLEIYANLGLLRWKHHNDVKGALKYFDLALNTPKPDRGEEGWIITDEAQEFVRSSVFVDLSSLHFELGNIPMAKHYAMKRLDVVGDCPRASRLLGACMLQADIAVDSIADKIMQREEPEELTLAIKCFRTSLRDDPNDLLSLYGTALSVFFLNLWAKLHQKAIEQSVVEEGRASTQHFMEIAGKSEMGKQLSDSLAEVVARISRIVVLKSAG